MLAKPWFIFSEVLHVFSLVISTQVCEENLFHFVSVYFISLHRKTKQKKYFKMQEPGLFLVPLDQRKIKNLSPFATIFEKIMQTKFQRKILNLVALGLLQTSILNRKNTQFLVNKTFLSKIIYGKFHDEISKIKTKELTCI